MRLRIAIAAALLPSSRPMSQAQKLVLFAGGLLIAALLIYPPWIEMYFGPDGQGVMKRHGYHFIWNQPAETEVKTRGMRIHSARLFKYVLPIGIATFIGYVLLAPKKRETETEKT